MKSCPKPLTLLALLSTCSLQLACGNPSSVRRRVPDAGSSPSTVERRDARPIDNPTPAVTGPDASPPVVTGPDAQAAGPEAGVKTDAASSPDVGQEADSAPPADARVAGPPSIDDFEDCDGAIGMIDGRHGPWTVNQDSMGSTFMKGAIKPTTGGATSKSKCAMRVRGTVFQDPVTKKTGYADLQGQLSGGVQYDVGGHGGVVFWAKGAGQVRVALVTLETTSLAAGGTCMQGCWDTHGATIKLNSGWTKHELRWAEFVQGGWGTPAELNLQGVLALKFEFLVGGQQVDFWLDDVAFLAN